MTDDKPEFHEMFEELKSDPKGRVLLYRESPRVHNGKNLTANCLEAYPLDGRSVGDYEELVEQTYGGGRFRFELRGSPGKVVARQSFDHPGDPSEASYEGGDNGDGQREKKSMVDDLDEQTSIAEADARRVQAELRLEAVRGPRAEYTEEEVEREREKARTEATTTNMFQQSLDMMRDNQNATREMIEKIIGGKKDDKPFDMVGALTALGAIALPLITNMQDNARASREASERRFEALIEKQNETIQAMQTSISDKEEKPEPIEKALTTAVRLKELFEGLGGGKKDWGDRLMDMFEGTLKSLPLPRLRAIAGGAAPTASELDETREAAGELGYTPDQVNQIAATVSGNLITAIESGKIKRSTPAPDESSQLRDATLVDEPAPPAPIDAPPPPPQPITQEEREVYEEKVRAQWTKLVRRVVDQFMVEIQTRQGEVAWVDMALVLLPAPILDQLGKMTDTTQLLNILGPWGMTKEEFEFVVQQANADADVATWLFETFGALREALEPDPDAPPIAAGTTSLVEHAPARKPPTAVDFTPEAPEAPEAPAAAAAPAAPDEHDTTPIGSDLESADAGD